MAYQSPDFAWKITDGDSTKPNKKQRRPCDNEGYPGHWILHFSSGFPPGIYKTREGTRDQFDPLPQPDFIKLGYYVQVNFTCAGNGAQSQPGVYLNHSMVCFAAFGTEISVGRDVASAGFGQSALPAGASMTPPAGAFAAAAPGLGTPVMGAPGGMPQMGMQQAAPLLPGLGMAGGAPMMGAPGGMPQMGMQPPPQMMAPPATPQYQMTPQAQAAGYTREALNAQGHSDAAIVAAGYMVQVQAPPAGLPMMGAPGGMPMMGMQQAPPPLAPGFSVPGGAGFAAPIAGAPGVQIPVTPNPGFLQIPAGGMQQAPQMMAAPAGPQLTPKAFAEGASSWAAMQQQGWTEPAARAQGYIA